ncbi:hypothetical protein MMIN_39150 [Mycolicibacter minnesotensis]|nr:hypothetical protein MMIN_39150 [Mycolicibacter minnesotensis]
MERRGPGSELAAPKPHTLGICSRKRGGGVRFRQTAWVRSSSLAEVPGRDKENIDVVDDDETEESWPFPVDRRTARRRVGEGSGRTSGPSGARDRLKRGGTNLKQVLKDAETDEVLGKMKVSALLEALPKVGKVKAQEIMTELEIAPTRRLRGLGDRQRKALLEKFDFS